MKQVLFTMFLIGIIGLVCVAGSNQHNRWNGTIPGSPYFTTNILVEDLTNSVTFTISNGLPIINKQ